MPYLAKPILYFSSLGFASVSLGMFWGSLLGVVGLFLIPLTLLGCVSPWTVRLAVVDVAGAGKTAGRLYAISTLGSLVGAYLPVLFLIPTVGTDRTFVLLSALLLITSLVGLAQERRAGITGEGLGWRQSAIGRPVSSWRTPSAWRQSLPWACCHGAL